MQKLTLQDLKDIENQMFNKSRDIDVCLFNYISGDFPQEMIIDALSMYQNKDGGFGHALDPDNLNPNSSSYQTMVALFYLYQAGYTSYLENEDLGGMLNKTFNYLYNKNPNWNLFEESNLKYACSQRFKEESKSLDLETNIIALTIYFLDEKKAYYKKAILKLDSIYKKLEVENSISLDEALSLKLLLKVLALKNIEVDTKVITLINDLISKSLKESKLSSINAYYYALLSSNDEEISEALDIIISSRKSHALWETENEWGNNYPEAESAKLKWLGAITTKCVALLKKYERIEE